MCVYVWSSLLIFFSRLLNLQAHDYMTTGGTKTQTETTGSTASLTEMGNLYGSELVQKSLEVVTKKGELQCM